MSISEGHFYLLAESSRDAIFIGVRGLFAYINPPGLKLFGAVAREELLGQPIIERIHPDHRPIAAERARLLYQGESLPPSERRCVRLDGVIVDVEVSAVPFRHHGEQGGLAFMRDITQRKRAEAEFRRHAEQLQLFRDMVDQSNDFIHVIDAETGRFFYVNKVAQQRLGYSPEELLTMTVADIDPDIGDWSSFRAQLPTTLFQHGTVFERRHQRRDGSIFPVEVSGRAVVHQGRRFHIDIARDISERKQAEDEIRALNQNLERRVRERTADVVQAKLAAERANDAKSRFLAAASHDLRQPLQGLNLFLEVLAQRLPPEDSAIMGPINRCVSSLSELLFDLLDLSKLDAGVIEPKPVDFPLSEVVEKAVSANSGTAKEKALRLRSVPTRLIVHSDPTLFERIVINFVSNAVRYTRRGGIVIGCRRRMGRIWLEVTDTGIGIPTDQQESIFEEFMQLANPERSSEKGSGLGLTIARKVAQRLGLEIRLTSCPGRGSTFAVEAPASSRRPQTLDWHAPGSGGPPTD